MNRKVVAAVALMFAFSLTFVQEAEARRRFGRGFGGRGFGRGGGSALAALAVGGLIANSFNSGYGYGGYGGYGRCGTPVYSSGYYDPYAAQVAYQPYAYGGAPYGYAAAPAYGYAAAPAYGYAPAGYGYGGYPGYYGRRRRSNVLPALIGAGIVYSILRNR